MSIKRVSGFLAIALMGFALAACSTDVNKIGSTIKGERLSILEKTKNIEADKELEGQKPQLPDDVTTSSWPQAGYDTTHVFPNAVFSEHPQEIWNSSIGKGSDSDFKLLARPVLADGRIFTMDAQGQIRAFDVKNGDEIWDFDTTPEDRDENAIGGGLGIDGDTLYATTGFGEVLALSAADGKIKWRKSLLNPIRAAPTIADGRVYVVSIDNQLQVLDAHSGAALWHHNGIAENATLMGASNPAVSGESVVVAYSSGEIFNLRAENGRVSWSYGLTTPTQVGALPAIADIRGLPVIDRGRVFAISHSGRMASIDHRTGDRAWENDIGGINTPVVAGDAIFLLSNDDRLIALARDTGRVMWTHDLQHLEDPADHGSDTVYWAGPTLAGKRLWLVNSLGQLASFSAEDGSSLEAIDLDNPTYIPPVVAEGVMYVVTDDARLVALR